jgi:8-oxo-dGTP diphosphatase
LIKTEAEWQINEAGSTIGFANVVSLCYYKKSMNLQETQILPAVAAAIFNDKGEVLLQRRRDVNQWGIISGHVEFGETLEEAILREVMEETNTKAKVIRFIGIYSSPVSQTYHYAERSVQYITSYFEVQPNEPLNLDFSNHETYELRYFPVEALPADLAQMSEYWLSDVLDKTRVTFVR